MIERLGDVRVTVEIAAGPVEPLLRETMLLFAASMIAAGRTVIVDKGLVGILSAYYEAMEMETVARGEPKRLDGSAVVGDIDRCVVGLTGGKDSALIMSIEAETRGPENVIGVYVNGLNRSEQPYERAAAARICDHVGSELLIIDGKVTGAMNRAGHAIGLRQQLILGVLVVVAAAKNCGTLALGTHYEKRSALYTESEHAITGYGAWLAEYGFEGLITTSMDEVAVLEQIGMEMLELTSSCYTQKNFRENHHERMAKKFPDSWVYPHGCGVCVKCLRINGFVAKQRGDDAMFGYVRGRWKKDHPDDPTLKAICSNTGTGANGDE